MRSFYRHASRGWTLPADNQMAAHAAYSRSLLRSVYCSVCASERKAMQTRAGSMTWPADDAALIVRRQGTHQLDAVGYYHARHGAYVVPPDEAFAGLALLTMSQRCADASCDSQGSVDAVCEKQYHAWRWCDDCVAPCTCVGDCRPPLQRRPQHSVCQAACPPASSALALDWLHRCALELMTWLFVAPLTGSRTLATWPHV